MKTKKYKLTVDWTNHPINHAVTKRRFDGKIHSHKLSKVISNVAELKIDQTQTYLFNSRIERAIFAYAIQEGCSYFGKHIEFNNLC